MEDSKSADFLERFFLNCGFGTRAIHAGEHVGQPQHTTHTGAIYQSSTFVFQNVAEGAAVFSGERPGYAYTRLGNPTVMLLEAKMNALEGKEVKLRDPEVRVSSLAFSSGMAAISSTLMAICSQGDTLILGDVLYGATQHLAENVLARFGVRSVEVATQDLDAVERVVKANPRARAILFETPTNPTLAVTDIAALAKIVKGVNPDMKVVVDNTFATPYLQRPLSLGADVVIHSTTKYLCGHGTVVGGVMTTIRDEVKDKAYSIVKDVGGNPSPFDAWLVNLGIKTLPLRMDRHCENALAIARYLEGHPKVERVYYPGLESSPGHAIARQQMGKFGGMVCFDIRGGLEAGRKLMDTIKVFSLAVSLGCVDSLIQHPASMTHACVPRPKREKVGITDGLVRVSVGVEDVDDLIQALDDALKAV
ncbi:MAG TPA: PLP-dependent aspartate aminotransferase family protein [Myxococcota bacterium]|nr:PLP-dependent aspartate aminotransferase family protein [Myxococcota bacterium]HRY92478.1 PLP-dependent aspartate aminotransferase family protein [Myxococcota bacterium]